jgi:hypothetical protein
MLMPNKIKNNSSDESYSLIKCMLMPNKIKNNSSTESCELMRPQPECFDGSWVWHTEDGQSVDREQWVTHAPVAIGDIVGGLGNDIFEVIAVDCQRLNQKYEHDVNLCNYWDSVYPSYPSESNPWVWIVEVEKTL